MRGKKSEWHSDPTDPARCRANKQRGHGNYETDRPPIIGTVGRETGQVRLSVIERVDKASLQCHVHDFTVVDATCYTDEWSSYGDLSRHHPTVCHSRREWARDDDQDGRREVHTNTIEGLWTTVRNFLRPFRGVHKKSLAAYIALLELHINHKRISPKLIAALVQLH